MPSQATQPTGFELAAETRIKLARVRAFIDEQGLEGVLFTRQYLVGWVTAGMEDLIVRGVDPSFVWALVTADRAYLLTQNVEGPRLEAEEAVGSRGFEVVQLPWYKGPVDLLVKRICDPEKVATDGAGPGTPMAAELQQLRLVLTAEEQSRMREVGCRSRDALEEPLARLVPGAAEHELCAEILRSFELHRLVASAVLIGSDERRVRFRHPTVSTKVIERDVLVVVVGVSGGLNVALSRTACFGDPESSLSERHSLAAEVEAREIAATRPGRRYGEALQAGVEAYAELGYPEEWRHHFQGGPIGYGGREFTLPPLEYADSFTSAFIEEGHAVAWNPTVQGGKSEDTFLVGASANEIVTDGGNWPVLRFETDGAQLERPAILRVAER